MRGPQGFIHGAEAGGLVNVITGTGEGEAAGQIGLEYGEFVTRKLDASAWGGGEMGDYSLSLMSLETDGSYKASAEHRVVVFHDASGYSRLDIARGRAFDSSVS